jgi:deoxyribodipyrimidine photo-lyase
MLGCLKALDEELRAHGSQLVVRQGRPEEVLLELAREADLEAVLFSSDISPYARARDNRVAAALHAVGARCQAYPGNHVVDVTELHTQSGGAFRVFSPFFRAWQTVPRRPVCEEPVSFPPLPNGIGTDDLPRTLKDVGVADRGEVPEPVVSPGEPAARVAAERWLEEGISSYGDRQNGVARPGTSQLSPYLRWGCLSPLALEQAAARLGGAGARAWIRQLCWRDFYAHVLWNWPENTRLEFQPRLRGLQWERSKRNLAAWQRGETGYPIVDAGMRQLLNTGWMHNRARLIVGSFLTKDLHLDWREGELWFQRLLLDGEPPQNNGNWQWIASVGTDPAPAYRRMYNPTLQAQRFDPDGTYIRRWVPELRQVSDERLFEPWAMSEEEQRAAGCVIGSDYPKPIVDHQEERRRALARYRTAA